MVGVYMAKPTERIDPTDIDGINERTQAWAAGGEAVLPIDIERIVIEADALAALADVVRWMSGGGQTLMVADHTPMSRRGDDLKALVEASLGRVAAVTVRLLPDDARVELHADLDVARQLAGELTGYRAVVAVGSGTITDLVKYARHLAVGKSAARLPLIFFPTAASVTAFTSAIAVLSADGVKRNFFSGLPEAIICDLRTLADAPSILTRAGFADVLARSVAYGDWYLAWQLGVSDGFSELAGRLLEPAEQRMIDVAEQVANAEPPGIRAVTEAVLLAGMAMTVVNETAPISGWEHVISHFLDMTADGDGRKMALHGAQVGVGTLIAARAYERTWDELALDRITAELTDDDVKACRETIDELFLPYDPTGRTIAEIWRELDPKLARWRAARDSRARFVKRKRAGEFDAYLRSVVRTSEQVAGALRRAGAPQRFADLNEPIPHAAAHKAVRFAHLVRSRFTIGDLLSHTGWLDAGHAESLLDEPASDPSGCVS